MITRYGLRKSQFIEFSQEVVETFRGFRQGPSENEVGGVLLGRIYHGSHVLVELATSPNSRDKAGRYFFDRSRPAAQTVVNNAWRASKGEQNYIGEWHSHPISHPVPSKRDRQMIRNMFRGTQREINFLFLVIVGTEENWVGIENGWRLRRLKPLRQPAMVGPVSSEDISASP